MILAILLLIFAYTDQKYIIIIQTLWHKAENLFVERAMNVMLRIIGNLRYVYYCTR